MISPTGARLGRAFLLFLVGVVALVTLIPFDFAVPSELRILWGGDLKDIASNVVLFVPLGFLLRLTRPAPHDPRALEPLVFGLLLSLFLESGQLFLPSRYSAPLDLITNATGAWLGALAHDAVSRRLQLTPALVGRLALELPLMGLVYLLVPLLWINALAGFGEQGPPLSTMLIGVLGAITLGQVYRHRFGPARALSPGRYALVGGAWFVAGAFPLFIARPITGLVYTTTVTLLILAWALRPAPTATERRYESDTLRLFAPMFALYLLSISGWPAGPSDTAAGLGAVANTTAILHALELLAAFTVLGYGLAEYRGRREQSFWHSIWIVFPVALSVAFLLELPASAQFGSAGAYLRPLLAALSAGYGSGIYHLQRSHVRFLLGVTNLSPARGQDPESASSPPHGFGV